MFYDHEILTRREHGIATVWLVATLGSRSSSKKINKRAILDVNIAKACETVRAPQAPMALRLQSNLLIGISRVYQSQCGYVLVDAESIQHTMRSLLKVMRASQLDPNAGKARPDQLILPDDPAFMPDVIPELDMDFALLDLSTPESSQHSSRGSCQSNASPLTSNGSHDGGFGIEIPSDPSAAPEPRDGIRQAGQERATSLNLDDDVGFLPDAGFEFDADGNLIDTAFDDPFGQLGTGEDPFAPSDRPSEVRPLTLTVENADAQNAEANIQSHDEVDQVLFEDEDRHEISALHADEPVPVPTEPAHGLDEPPIQIDDPEDPGGPEQEMVVARVRRARGPQSLKNDARTDVRSSELKLWQTEYVANMRDVKTKREQKRTSHLAKEFAASCVWGNGLAGLGKESDIMRKHGPLNSFAGDGLREMVFGKQPTPATNSKKRKSIDDEPTMDEEGRKRRKSDEIEAVQQGEDDFVPNFEEDIEIGREAPEALEDVSSQMPWNSVAGGSRAGSIRPPSRAGSVAIPGSAAAPVVPYSAGRAPSSATSDLNELRRRRLPTASPLQDRGMSSNGADHGMGDGGFSLMGDYAFDDFELYGPAANVDTQEAGLTQWAQSALRKEEGNFLDWINAEMEKNNLDEITFEQLVPPNENKQPVAAQAFLHVLGLATKGALEVRQDAGFAAPIHLALMASA